MGWDTCGSTSGSPALGGKALCSDLPTMRACSEMGLSWGARGRNEPPRPRGAILEVVPGGTVPDPCCARPGPWPKQKGSDQSDLRSLWSTWVYNGTGVFSFYNRLYFFFHTKFGLCTVTYCGLSACWVRPEERAALQGTHGGGWGKISLSLLWFLNPNRFREQNEPQNKQQDLLYGRNCGQKERQQSPELCTGTQLLSFRQLLWYWCPDQCCWAGQSSFNWSAQDTACFCTTVGKTQLFVCLCTWRSAVPRADVRVMLLPWPRKLRWLLYVPVSGASCH